MKRLAISRSVVRWAIRERTLSWWDESVQRPFGCTPAAVCLPRESTARGSKRMGGTWNIIYRLIYAHFIKVCFSIYKVNMSFARLSSRFVSAIWTLVRNRPLWHSLVINLYCMGMNKNDSEYLPGKHLPWRVCSRTLRHFQSGYKKDICVYIT